MELTFEYTDASEKMKIIHDLTDQKNKLSEDYQRMRDIGDFKRMQEIGMKKNAIKAQLSELRDSIEYIELRIFCQVIKTYLTKEQYYEAWERVHAITTHPELYLKDFK